MQPIFDLTATSDFAKRYNIRSAALEQLKKSNDIGHTNRVIRTARGMVDQGKESDAVEVLLPLVEAAIRFRYQFELGRPAREFEPTELLRKLRDAGVLDRDRFLSLAETFATEGRSGSDQVDSAIDALRWLYERQELGDGPVDAARVKRTLQAKASRRSDDGNEGAASVPIPDIGRRIRDRETHRETDAVSVEHVEYTAQSNIASQTENSRPLDLVGTYVIVPPELFGPARRLAHELHIPGDVFNIEVRSEARLTAGVTDPVDGTSHAGSATTWYLAAGDAPTIEFGFIDSNRPTVRSFELKSGGRWGMGFDVVWDVGAKALDYRGLHKSTA